MKKEDHICIDVYREEYKHAIIHLITGIQQKEFGLPITASDQPDLLYIPSFYQSNHGNFWVALQHNRVVGCIGLLDLGEGQAALRKMFVDATFRGQTASTARRLLDTLLHWAESQRLKNIYLGTTPLFLAAHRFYEKNGFTEIAQCALPSTFPIMKVDTKFYKYDVSTADSCSSSFT
ncbi:GNAT family N-acetyltransferase [Desulfovibrio inopinatus]|uniref:GNAT family N-acetyltransferase n=1 Tax=Desulfovibrio inopinatus TaxID=102109 RepID=UPI00040539E8|nr:GNAT family N-acetyltransferase [Desulfovibrio inopinatus]